MIVRRARRDAAAGRRLAARVRRGRDRGPGTRRARPAARAILLLAVALVFSGFGSTVHPPGPRPVVAVPAPLQNRVTRPCVLYSCASDPGAHTAWESTVASLPGDYCTEYRCSPMDLIPSNGFDDNLFPFDPDWASFVETGTVPDANRLCQSFSNGLGSPPCTGQPVTYDAPGVDTLAYFLCPAGRSPYSSFHGHVDYEPATYQGTLGWESKAPWYADDEYSLNLRTPNGHGATTGDAPGSIHIEFDASQTIDHFDSSPWWKSFHAAVDAGDAHARSVVDGDLAVVTGLIGLDTAHTPAAESHPVYAMAIQTDRKAALAGGTDRWAIFARSWGNEGYCSQRDHPLPPGPLTLRIPWLEGASGAVVRPATQVKVTSTDDLSSNIDPHGTLAISVLPGEGVLLTFDLSAPASREPLYWGTIDLRWTFGRPQATMGGTTTTRGAPSTSRPATLPKSVSSSGRNSSAGTEGSDVETLAEALWQKLPRTTRSQALAAVPRRRVASPARPVRTAETRPPVAPLRRFGAFVQPAPDRALIARGVAQRQALCRAYGNRVPDHPALC